MSEPIYEDTVLAMRAFDRAANPNFCRPCWGPLDQCPGHQGYMEMFGLPPTEEQRAAYLADLEVRKRGIERQQQALNTAAVELGYGSIEDLCDKVMPRYEVGP